MGTNIRKAYNHIEAYTMWNKITLTAIAFVSISAVLLWTFRFDALVVIASLKSKKPVAENQDVLWQQGPSEKQGRTDQPNIVLILADDMGINDVSTFGGGMIETPNIDKLAAKGALFTNGYAGHANCAPSRAALLTGRDATRTGYDLTPIPDGMSRIIAAVENNQDNGRPKMSYSAEADANNSTYDLRGLPSAEILIPEIIKESGYHTMHIGKWHLGRGPDMMPNAQGFDESLMMDSGLYLPIDHPDAVNAPTEYSGLDRFIWATMRYSVNWNGGEIFEPKGYLTDYFTAEAEKAIEANANRPFFLYLAHWGPHNPVQAQRSDYEAVGDIQPHNKRVYAAMLRSIDRSIERVMAKLEEQGIADNTIVILSSDNGGADYVAIDDLNKPYRGWKNTFFEGGIRVPFSVTWPNGIKENTVIDEPVNHLDLMPTIINMANAPLPQDREIDGVDLAPLWQDKAEFVRPKNALFWFTGDYRVVQSKGWKLQQNPKSGQTFLHNLNVDPTEKNNVFETEPQKLAELTQLIDDHFADAVDSLGESTIAAPVTVDKHLGEHMNDGDSYIIWNN